MRTSLLLPPVAAAVLGVAGPAVAQVESTTPSSVPGAVAPVGEEVEVVEPSTHSATAETEAEAEDLSTAAETMTKGPHQSRQQDDNGTPTTQVAADGVAPTSVISASLSPPSAVLGSAAGEAVGDPVSYCWTVPADTGAPQTLCVDGMPPPSSELPPVTATRGASLSLRFNTTASPTEVQVTATSAAGNDQRLHVAAANPTQLSAELSPGVYVLSVFTRWDSGDAGYVFRLEVDASGPAPSTSIVQEPPSERLHQLPATGSDVGVMAGAGAAMIMVGATVLMGRRRLTWRTLRARVRAC